MSVDHYVAGQCDAGSFHAEGAAASPAAGFRRGRHPQSDHFMLARRLASAQELGQRQENRRRNLGGADEQRSRTGAVMPSGSAELCSRREPDAADRRDDRRLFRRGGGSLWRARRADCAPPADPLELAAAPGAGRRFRRRTLGPRARTRRADRHLVAEHCRMDRGAIRHRQGRADPRQHQPRLSRDRTRICAEQGRLRRAHHRGAVPVERLFGVTRRVGAGAGGGVTRRLGARRACPICAW